MLSIWEKQSFLKYDFIILGAGIVGLSTAISLKERNKNASILILERGILPTGASTKNAGFACFGSFTELLVDIENMGEKAALQIVQDRWNGLIKLRKRLKNHDIMYHNYGGYELLNHDEIFYLEKLSYINQLLRPLFNEDVFIEKNYLISDFGFNPSNVKSLIYNSFEGQLDSGKMMKGLIKLAYSLEIEIITGAEATSFVQDNDKISIEVENKLLKNRIAFEATALAICTNAFTKKLLPEVELNPGRGLILVTKPLPNLLFKGAFHFQEGYFYFRNYENRILFGGGRNLDFKKETSTDFLVNEDILDKLHNYLQNMIIPGQEYEVDHVWSGIMAFGKTKQPLIQKIDNKIVAGVRLGGMGVAIGTIVGEKLAIMLLE